MHVSISDVFVCDGRGIQLTPTRTFLNSFCLEPTPRPGIPATSLLPDGSIGKQYISLHIYL